ncbi:MAG: hypothetical protein IJJ33_17050 [Victivallales bacterium]|nr:hypothetical protein [Victivallales bacterium]
MTHQSIHPQEQPTNHGRPDDAPFSRLPDDYPAPRGLLPRHFPAMAAQCFFQGGWGYDQPHACIVITQDDEVNPGVALDGISLENLFIHYRIREEIEFAHGVQYVGMEWQKTGQELFFIKSRPYDKIYVAATAFSLQDWEFLKNDWESHQGYKKDPDGYLTHQLLRAERQVAWSETFWFDITDFL